jgi:Histidine kinase
MRPSRWFWVAQLATWSLYFVVSALTSLILPGLSAVRETAVPAALVETLPLIVASTAIQLRLNRLPGMASGGSVASTALRAWLVAGTGAVLLIELLSHLVPGVREARLSLTAYFGPPRLLAVAGAISVYGVLGGWLAASLAVRSFRQRALLTAAQLDALRYQLNPHFLFNTLNSLRGLIAESPPRAQQMVEQLADFLRSTLAPAHGGLLPLLDELELARRYLALEKVRFEENLQVSFAIDPAAEALLVPPLVLNPLVENAVKFGHRTSQSPLRIEVSSRVEGGVVRLRVSNTGQLVSPTPERHALGLKNVRERLELVFPGGSGLDLAAADGWVHATLRLPVRRATR